MATPIQSSGDSENVKVLLRGVTSLSPPTVTYNNNINYTTTSKTIAHNLGFVPTVLAFYGNGTEKFPLPLSAMTPAPGSPVGNFSMVEVSYSVDENNLYFENKLTVSQAGSGSAEGLTVEVTYYLLRLGISL